MYDLVSTSLPNGLLPGTHGFATVAMTRGTPDSVRVALESLSSYKHRHTGHDARYATENPVAWSHLVQRDGSHVLSCVRAAEFDYTGRTNRLAHHWCFPRGEFPAETNAADMIAANTESLSAAWSGTARWLDPAANPATAVPSRTDLRAVAWMHFYGPERGPALAASFATLLREELQGTNRPIVFRTSQAWDVHGTNLLQLFADIIALLPAQLRDRATFSTYPAALPDYVTCHLRGTQLDDPKFAAYTAGRPWFDCTTGEAHGSLPQDSELLYVAQHGHERLVVSRGPKPIDSRAVPGALSTEKDGAGYPSVTFQPSPPARTKASSLPSRNDWLPPPKKDNTTLYAIIGGLAITVAVLAAFVLLRTGPKPPPPATQPEEPELVPVSESLEEPLSVAKPDKPPAETNKTESIAATATVDKPSSGDTSVPTTTPPPPLPLQKWEFEEATRLVFQLQDPKEFKSGFYFFYPSAEAALEKTEARPKDPPVGVPGTKTWGKTPNFSTCLVLYDKEEKTVYYKWNPFAYTKFFAEANSVDMQTLCFGSDPAVFKTWDRLCSKFQWKYSIKWKNSSGTTTGTFERGPKDRMLTDDDTVGIIAKSKLEELDAQIAECQAKLTAAESALATAEQSQAALDTERKKADKFASDMKGIDAKISANNNALSSEGEKKKDEAKIKKIKDDITELRNQQAKIKSATEAFVEQLPPSIKTNAQILTKDEPQIIVTKMNRYKEGVDRDVAKASQDVINAQTALDAAKTDKTNYVTLSKSKERLQSMEFTVSIVVKEAGQ